MPTAKVKGGSSYHRYRPASEYDDATLAQKREYWRNKKREQRARLSEHREMPAQVCHGKRPSLINVHGDCAVQGFFNASLRNGNEVGDIPPESQMGKCTNSTNLNKVLPCLPAPFSITTKAAGVDVATAMPPFTGTRAIHSATSSETQLIDRFSVPLVKLTRVTNGSSIKTAPNRLSMQDTSISKTQDIIQTAYPRASTFVSSSSGPFSGKTEVNASNLTQHLGKRSALVSAQRVKCVTNAKTSNETDEEKAAKRREQWRIKKREQRAKLPARIAKARERTHSTDLTRQGMKAVGIGFLSSQAFATRPSQRAGHSLGKMSVTSIRRIVEPQRKLPCFGTGGVVQCKTARQKFIEAQKNLMHQMNLKCRSPMLSSRNMPKIDPDDTSEQIIEKRREYWRIKKREQRAKLSMDTKVRLKEKDSLMRRVKRYQKILEDMRKARTLTHTTVDPLAHSDTIGGFIEEDGTLTMNVLSNSTPHTGESNSKSPTYCKHNDTSSIRMTHPTPSLHPVQVRVSVPLAGHYNKKPPQLMSIKPHTESTTAPTTHTPTVGQLRLSHPQTAQKTLSAGSQSGANLGGCVMKMAVSSHASSPLNLHPELTEEERMARRREYWRIKKREQRAARAVRLKQGLLQVRAMAALERRKAKKQVVVTSANVSHTEQTGNAQTATESLNLPHVNEIKKERECFPTEAQTTQSETTLCLDIKPPPIPLLVSPIESDPAQSADCQTATLLAVASMRKLLEESLSTVSEHRSEQLDIKQETLDEASEQDIKPELAQMIFEKEDVAPVSADLTLLPVDSDISEQADFPCTLLKSSPRPCETPPPLHHSADVEQRPTCEQSSHLEVTPSLEDDAASSPSKIQILQCFRSPGSLSPPRLTGTDATQQQQNAELLCKPPDASQDINPPTRQEGDFSELRNRSSLQRKREYWKLMKRQQRARLKAQQRDRQEESSSRLSDRDVQVPGLVMIKPKVPAAPLAVVSSIATLLVVTHTQAGHQSPGTVPVKRPVSITEQNPMRAQQSSPLPPETPRLSPSWTHGAEAHSLPTLKPPENPLSSIQLQPIELCHSPENTAGPTSSHLRSNSNHVQPNKMVPVSTMVPPKPIRGESGEDFLKRKREYWRIKKKEQRARKAVLHKNTFSTRKASSSCGGAVLTPTQDEDWLNSSEDSEHLISASKEDDPGCFPYSDYTLEGEPELLLPDYENANGEDAPLSDAMWRNRFLMDYDPLNQLLVCMVCGELQYSHSMEGVRAHIDDAHPHTLTLDAEERVRMMQSWDEQVSQRERFFTSQLQQHSSTGTEAHLS